MYSLSWTVGAQRFGFAVLETFEQRGNLVNLRSNLSMIRAELTHTYKQDAENGVVNDKTNRARCAVYKHYTRVCEQIIRTTGKICCAVGT